MKVVLKHSIKEGMAQCVIGKEIGTLRNAAVVCRMLGYRGANYSYRCCSGKFENGTGEILFNSVECTREERSMLTCKHYGIGGEEDVYYSLCHHGYDSAVKCYEERSLEGS